MVKGWEKKGEIFKLSWTFTQGLEKPTLEHDNQRFQEHE